MPQNSLHDTTFSRSLPLSCHPPFNPLKILNKKSIPLITRNDFIFGDPCRNRTDNLIYILMCIHHTNKPMTTPISNTPKLVLAIQPQTGHCLSNTLHLVAIIFLTHNAALFILNLIKGKFLSFYFSIHRIKNDKQDIKFYMCSVPDIFFAVHQL